jgi:hypothetical protein
MKTAEDATGVEYREIAGNPDGPLNAGPAKLAPPVGGSLPLSNGLEAIPFFTKVPLRSGLRRQTASLNGCVGDL